MLFIAHRGFRVGVIENTCNAFLKALQLKMDYIELDVQLSKDQILYILHDATLTRTMGVEGTLGNFQSEKLDQIHTIDGNWKIPRLQTLLEYLQSHPEHLTKLMIELKGPGTGVPTARLVNQLAMEHKVVFSGRYLQELIDAHHVSPNIPLCLNITKCKEFTLTDFLTLASLDKMPLPFMMMSLKSNSTDMKSFINQCHHMNIQALCWNFIDSTDPIMRMEELTKNGIDGILFDDPATVSPIRSFISTNPSDLMGIY